MILDKIRDFLKRDGGDLKMFLLSLLSAFSVWLVYNLTLNYTKIVSVPIVAKSNIKGHRQSSSGSATVLARCHTRGFDLLKLSRLSDRNPLVVEFDAADFKQKGDELFYITSGDLEKYSNRIFGDKSGMENYVTDTLYFRFPFENHKTVPVVPVVSVSYHPQYISPSGIRMSPDSVTVYGDPAILNHLDRVLTRPFDLEDIKSPVHGEIRLEDAMGLRLSSERVDYVLDVLRYVDIPAKMRVQVTNAPSDKFLRVYPSEVEVVFRCAWPASDNLMENSQLIIDYKDFAKSLTGSCIPQIANLPAGVLSYSLNPEVLECIESDSL